MTVTSKLSKSEYEAMRQMWVGVANAVIETYRLKISASQAGKKSVNIEGNRFVVSSPSNEISEARRYFHSDDFRDICELAGIGFKPEIAIKWVTSGESTRKLRRAWQ